MGLFKRWGKWHAKPPAAQMPADERAIIDISELTAAYKRELALRHCPDISPFAFADYRGGTSTLLATTAAVNLRAILGGNLGDGLERAGWAEHIANFGLATLRDNGVSDPEHAICMAIQALNLLGPVPILPAGCFASRKVEDVDKLIAAHDWRSTHKALWGRVAPLLASGLVDGAWRRRLFDAICNRLRNSAGLVDFGLDPDADAARTISVLYHIGMIYDAARAPYPHAREMILRLLDINWPKKRLSTRRTLCSDADWAWLLMVSTRQEPEYFPVAIENVRQVALMRATEWNDRAIDLTSMSTHHLYCHLWSTALFQDLSRECFSGPFIPDTLNQPALFRLRITESPSEGILA